MNLDINNGVVLAGNLGSDPSEIASDTVSGVRFSVAQNVNRFNEKTKKFETIHTNWLRVSAWGKLANSVKSNLKKGDRIQIAGVLRTSEYEEKGEKRYSTEIVARSITRSSFLRAAEASGADGFDEQAEDSVSF